MKKGTLVVLAMLLCISSVAQTIGPKARKNQPKAPLPVYGIALSEDGDYQPLPWPKNSGGTVPSYCNGDGNFYSRPKSGLVGLTPKGIVSFLSDKMTDVSHPSAVYRSDVVISASGVFLLVTGIDDQKVDTTTSTNDGGTSNITDHETDATLHYIARFGKDGTYKGAIKLDLPFVIDQFAAFD